MSTVSARTQFILSARDQTGAGIGSARRSLLALEAAGSRVRGAFAGMFAGFLGGNIIKNVVRSFIEINKNLDPVKNSFTTMDRAWQQFALNVGRSGLNSALIEFNTRMAMITGSLDGLSGAIGRFLGGTVRELAQVFEYLGRAVAFVGENMNAFKGVLDSFTGNTGPKKIIDVDAAALDWLKSMGLNTKAFTQDLSANRAELAKLPPTFREIAGATKLASDAREKLVATGQRMWLETQTPMEKYKAGVLELNVLQSQGVLIQDTYARQMARLKEEFLGTGKASVELGATLKDTLGDSLKGMFDDALNGTFKLKNALTGLISQIARAGFNNFLEGKGGTGGGGGFLGSLLNLFKGNSFGGLYADGGTLGAGKWGIAGERGPEAIVGPATVIPTRGSGYAKVTVNNYGSQVRTQERTDGMGQKELIVMVDQRIARQTGDPYSRSSDALSARGARPPLKQR